MQSHPFNLNQAELRLKLTLLDCMITCETTLATKPGSIHWHIKHLQEPRGILEATWLANGEAWLSYHANRYQPWIDDVLAKIS